MKYSHTIFYVENVQETLEFYQNALGFDIKFTTPEKDYGEINSGETTLGFANFELADFNLPKGYQKMNKEESPIGIEIAFTSDHIEADLKRAQEAGAEIYQELTDKPWGQKVAYIRDNNGFLIEIGTPMVEE